MGKTPSIVGFKPSPTELANIHKIRASILNEKGVFLTISDTLRYALDETAKMLCERHTELSADAPRLRRRSLSELLEMEFPPKIAG